MESPKRGRDRMKRQIVCMVGMLTLLPIANARCEITEASYYTRASCLREGTSGVCANGERLNDEDLTCASWDYKFNTLLRVQNLSNGKEVIVRVNDRGPARRLYRNGRKIDLSLKAFRTLSPLSKGIIKVKVERVML